MLRRLILLLVLLALPLVVVRADDQFSIVTPAWVAAHAQDANIRILDVRPDVHPYFIGHVPNAVHMADGTLRGPREWDSRPVSSGGDADGVALRAGVRTGQTVVIYTDGEELPGATMVAYVLEKLGYPRTAILDGGWSAYKATQQAAQAYPVYIPERFAVRVNNAISVDLAQVRLMVGKPGITFIDARPNNMYTGEEKVWIRNGHIPGAINIDWHSLMDPNNFSQFKPIANIQAIYDAKGIKKMDNIVLYCGTSREASVEFQVLKHLLGYPNVRLYEGAWKEYAAYPDLPIETGNPK